MTDPLLDRARRAWVELADAPVAFPERGAAVVVSEGSALCPPGWVGVVALGGSAIATVPTDAAAPVVERVLAALDADPTAADRLRDALGAVEVLGPATLAYRDADPPPGDGVGAVDAVPAGHLDLAALLATADAADAAESGLAGITSPAFVVREAGEVVAAAGYGHWPGEVAHLCVLTAAGHRGRGHARTAAGAAVAHALADGLLPQWRARPEPSRRVAAALGFRRLGAQISVRLPG